MANTFYENVVLGNKITDILATSVDLTKYVTVDTSLAEAPGMIKRVNVYDATGDVEDLAMGAGNTGDISVSFTSKDYKVGVTQGRFQYYDEQAMSDPMVVEAGLQGIAKTMVNDFTTKAVDEWHKTSLSVTGTGMYFNDIVDAIAKLNVEDEKGLFLMCGVEMVASLRKELNDSLKYSEGFVRTGYIGSVAGVPVICSKAIEGGTMYLASPEAVTLFIKKDTEVEQERDANTRNNKVYIRKVAVVALTDATKVVKITETV